MSAGHDDEHGHGHHSGDPTMDWIILHMGGMITYIGQAFEKVVEKAMMPAVNGVFMRLAKVYLVIFTPLVLMQFVVYLLKGVISF